MKRNARFLVPFVALLLLLGSTAPASAQLRGMRYCEVLAVFPIDQYLPGFIDFTGNIVGFTGGDLTCRPNFYARCAQLIKENTELWVLVESIPF